jgi:hypothetical protein
MGDDIFSTRPVLCGLHYLILYLCLTIGFDSIVADIAEQIQEGKIFEVVIHEVLASASCNHSFSCLSLSAFWLCFSGVSLLKVVNILHHGISLYDEFRAAVAAWKGGDYFTSGVNVGEILGILLQD